MSLTGLLVFASVYAMAVATPGPGIAAVVARVLARGIAGAPAFILGFVVGDLVWFGLAVAGLAVLANTFHMVFVVIKYAGVAYLLYMAYRLWTAPAATPESADTGSVKDGNLKLFLTSLSLTLGNPKVIVFFMAILPTVVDLQNLTVLGAAEIALIIAVIITAVMTGYALAAARARQFFRSARAMKIVNRVCGATIAGAAVVVATR